MSAPSPMPLPKPPRGFAYYRSRQEILHSPTLFAYQHMLLRAWEEMNLSGVLTLDGIPTVYVRDEDKPITARQAAKVQGQFWNQGIATVLLLRDPHRARVFSSMTAPVDPETATDTDIDQRLVETLDLGTQASWAARLEKLYLRIGTGAFYRQHEDKYDPEQTVDAYLLENLAAVRDELVKQGLKPQFAHAFLGRLLFTCYLCDRGILKLANHFPGQPWTHLHELLAASGNPCAALYDTLFPELKHDFNSSMFDDDLDVERELIQPEHFEVVRHFLQGDEIAQGHNQRSLGFWAYDFKFIPVETISAIYESFLGGEDGKRKHASGAFYTPRFLAEMTLDLALEGISPLYGKDRRYLTPRAGPGFFSSCFSTASPPSGEPRRKERGLRRPRLTPCSNALMRCVAWTRTLLLAASPVSAFISPSSTSSTHRMSSTTSSSRTRRNCPTSSALTTPDARPSIPSCGSATFSRSRRSGMANSTWSLAIRRGRGAVPNKLRRNSWRKRQPCLK